MAKAEQPTPVPIVQELQRRRSTALGEDREPERLLEKFQFDWQAGNIRLFGCMGNSWEPYREIPLHTQLEFKLAYSWAREKGTGAYVHNVCVVPTTAESGSTISAAVEEKQRGRQTKRATAFLIKRFPPFGVPPDGMSVKAVHAMLDEELESENENLGLRTPSRDVVDRCIKRAAKKAKAAKR
jgi:hypothetical protein